MRQGAQSLLQTRIMLKAIILVAAAAAAQNATINLFTAVDKPAYLAERFRAHQAKKTR